MYDTASNPRRCSRLGRQKQQRGGSHSEVPGNLFLLNEASGKIRKSQPHVAPSGYKYVALRRVGTVESHTARGQGIGKNYPCPLGSKKFRTLVFRDCEGSSNYRREVLDGWKAATNRGMAYGSASWGKWSDNSEIPRRQWTWNEFESEGGF